VDIILIVHRHLKILTLFSPVLIFQARRTFAADATPTPPTPPPAKKSGAGLFQRISSFFVGAGLTALVTQFYIFKELTEGNNQMIASQKEIEKRLAKLEK
jgi:hypothetical protein